jgi:hypothetical protein
VSSNVVDLPVITKLNLDPERVLAAAQGKLESVVIVGYTKDGDEYFASSIADGADVVWMLERAKIKLLSVREDEMAVSKL